MIKIELLHYTPLNIAVRAMLTCTKNENKTNEYDVESTIKKLVDQGHESVIEHINYNFYIDGLSRSCLQELARHRHISLSVASTRWVLPKFLNTPVDKIFPKFKSGRPGEDWQKELCDKYKEVMDLIVKLKHRHGLSNDELKYYLPEAIPCSLMLTCNARELRHIFELRTSSRALLEFRNLCKEIYDVLPDNHKFMYQEYIIEMENNK